jgi:uncharacterized protein YdeI (YjbR/CyaY-like superfamily)
VAEPTFFASPDEFRAWLAEHAATAPELLVGYWKKGTGRPSMTWAESVDEALCYGWIDGLRRSLGDEAYCIRFTPRRASSVWSAVNVRRVPELVAEGRMTPAGLAVWETRRDEVGYTYERREATLTPEQEAALRAVPGAWEFWERQPPGYRRIAAHWVNRAKQDATRARRLAALIDACVRGERVRGG